MGKVEQFKALELSERLRYVRDLIVGKVKRLQAGELAERLRQAREFQTR
jgi:hypothetical protein